MSSFVLCVGCGASLYGFSPCRWCACEQCGNDSLCNSGNSYVYDPNPNSFDCPPDSYHPPYPTYETYSYDSYGNDSHFCYDCQPQFLLNYESEPGYIENYNSYPYDSSSVPQQYPCCTRCRETKFDEFIKSSVENLIPIPSESEGILEHMCDGPFHENSQSLDVLKDQFEDFSKSNDEFSLPDDDSFAIDNIDYVEASPPDSELVSSEVIEIIIPETKSSSTSLNSLLVETNTFDNSLPEFETFCFDVEEISSGSTTTHSDIFLLEYEAFYDDHVKEISSGSPTTHSDSPLYESFIFDLSINPFPPADRSDFYKFTDELIHFISPPEYDCFLFKIKPNSGDFTKDVVKDISLNKEPQVHNALPTHPTLQLNLKFQPSSESLFTYVVWIFIFFLVYSVAP
nr:hypothetical protein [Tanacetum cinerariifolium]